MTSKKPDAIDPPQYPASANQLVLQCLIPAFDSPQFHPIYRKSVAELPRLIPTPTYTFLAITPAQCVAIDRGGQRPKDRYTSVPNKTGFVRSCAYHTMDLFCDK